MPSFRRLRRLTRAERIRVSFTDAGGGLRLPLASRRTWIPGLAVGIAFLVVTSIAWQQFSTWRRPAFDTWVHGVMAVLGGLWLVGLWAGAVVLLLLTVVLLFYHESARLADNQLIHVVRIGPVRVFLEYELAHVRNLRATDAGNERAVVRFDYDDGDDGLGSDMTLAEAAARVKMIQTAIDALGRRRSQPGAAASGPTPKPQGPRRE